MDLYDHTTVAVYKLLRAWSDNFDYEPTTSLIRERVGVLKCEDIRQAVARLVKFGLLPPTQLAERHLRRKPRPPPHVNRASHRFGFTSKPKRVRILTDDESGLWEQYAQALFSVRRMPTSRHRAELAEMVLQIEPYRPQHPPHRWPQLDARGDAWREMCLAREDENAGVPGSFDRAMAALLGVQQWLYRP